MQIMPLVLSLCSFFPAAQGDKSATDLVFIGTYTNGKSKGIYRAEFDPKTGKLSQPELAAETPNPSFLAIHPDGKSLYCVNEIGGFGGKKSGALTGFSLDGKTGALKQLFQKATGGPSPCHVTVHPSGKFAAVVNYGGGGGATNAFVIIDLQGGGLDSEYTYGGNSVDKNRQQAPHPHSVNFTPKGDLMLVADLGIDQVKLYGVAENGRLHKAPAEDIRLAPGAGPRHLDVNRKGDRIYVVNELNSTVTVFALAAGKWKELQTISTLPKDVSNKNSYTAEIRIHHELGYVYASNRGHDSIAIFKIDPADGTLTAAGHQQHKDMKTPRNFTLHGNFLLAAGQSTHKIVVFRINEKTGELQPTDQVVDVPSPVCIRILRRG